MRYTITYGRNEAEEKKKCAEYIIKLYDHLQREIKDCWNYTNREKEKILEEAQSIQEIMLKVCRRWYAINDMCKRLMQGKYDKKYPQISTMQYKKEIIELIQNLVRIVR